LEQILSLDISVQEMNKNRDLTVVAADAEDVEPQKKKHVPCLPLRLKKNVVGK